MPNKPRPHPHPNFTSMDRDHFIEFIRRVSPEADPTSVLLFGQIHRANNLLTQAAEKRLSEAGLSWAKFRLLMNLHRAEKHNAAEGLLPSVLSELQGISRNTASALIAGLEEERLVSRTLHGKDRRKFVIRLTPRGRAVLKARLDGQFQFVSRCFDVFDSAERRLFLDLLVRLNESMQETAP